MTPEDARARAAAWRLVLSSTLFGIMALLAKTASRGVPGTEVACVRLAIGVAATGLLWAAGRIVLRPRRWGWLLVRGLFGGAAVIAYFSAMQRIAVGEATLLNYTQPVFTMLAAWLLLGERPPRRALLALPLTLAGVALIVGIHFNDLHASVGQLLGLSSAVLSGIAVTSIRAARRETVGGPRPESPWTVFLAFSAVGFVLTLPTVLPPFGHWIAPTPREWGLLVAVGVTSLAAQVLMTEAMQHLRVGAAGIITQLTALVAIGGGALVLGEALSPSFLGGAALTLAGVALVVLAGAPRFFSKRRV